MRRFLHWFTRPFLVIVGFALLVFFAGVLWDTRACAEETCRISLCNEDTICPGACSCSRAPGQPWGRCQPW